jgi:hypothetical protein
VEIEHHSLNLLGGFSVGGHIAIELAQRLRSMGEAVPLLFLVDAYGPALRARLAGRIRVYLGNFWQRSRHEKREFFSEKIAWWRFLLQVQAGNRDAWKRPFQMETLNSDGSIVWKALTPVTLPVIAAVVGNPVRRPQCPCNARQEDWEQQRR